ncbi:MAG: hypothetical protein JNL31_11350 [Tabrizicola sp.]|nr:hypothetical protein [Tabrizicola sp.]
MTASRNPTLRIWLIVATLAAQSRLSGLLAVAISGLTIIGASLHAQSQERMGLISNLLQFLSHCFHYDRVRVRIPSDTIATKI